MTATVERIESWLVDVPTIRPHKLDDNHGLPDAGDCPHYAL
jgi:hypothetical protein